MTKYDNRNQRQKDNLTDAGEINNWIHTNIPNTADKPTSIEMNADGTIKICDIDYNFTAQEKAILISKFPELNGKEV